MKSVNLIWCLAVSTLFNYVDSAVVRVTCDDNPGYYWRDYLGQVPSDAIRGGIDNQGRITYIGQTLHPGNGITPGLIKPNEQKIFYEFGSKELSSTEDVKILCSKHPERLRWVTTKQGESVTNVGRGYQLVPGGHDRSRLLGIGRKAINTGEVIVSKVLTIDNKFEAIYLISNGRGWSDQGPYEVLVYNPNFADYEHNLGNPQVINIHIDK